MASKPKLKLVSKTATPSQEQNRAETPASTTSATPKITLKIGKKNETPQALSTDPQAKKKPKSGRKAKPTAKKRAAEEEGQSENEGNSVAEDATVQNPKKKIKLSLKAKSIADSANKPSVTPYLKLNAKGKVPPRPIGVGYDSEDSEREKDPTIIDNVILRMVPGDDCTYLREAVASRRFGPVKDGGADVRMRFLTKDGRRATITIRGRMYAAILVDLPCIIEAMKSWEKKSWWKSADICQMLLVLGQCKNEDEAISYPLPGRKNELDEKTWAYAHGLTPPMRWVRKRRFRKRISVKAVEEDEREVERLLQADEECVKGTSKYRVYENIDDYERETSLAQASSSGSEDEGEDEVDAEGEEVDAEGEVVDDLEAQAAALEAFFEAQADDGDVPDAGDAAATATAPAAASTTTSTAPPTTTTPTAAAAQSPPSSAALSPAIAQIQSQDSPAAATTSGDDESEDDESDEDEEQVSPADDDPEAMEAEQELQRQREDIADLEAMIAREQAKLGQTSNAMLRQKVQGKIDNLASDLEVRKRTLGMEGGDESEAD